jgi:hypothetical protein
MTTSTESRTVGRGLRTAARQAALILHGVIAHVGGQHLTEIAELAAAQFGVPGAMHGSAYLAGWFRRTARRSWGRSGTGPGSARPSSSAHGEMGPDQESNS